MPNLMPINDAITAAFNALPTKMAGRQARLMLLAIQLQEDPKMLRRQVKGPARGWAQFEVGGVRGVMSHASTTREAYRISQGRTAQQVQEAMEFDDVLTACFARLLLWSDPKPLPAIGEVRQAFDLYLRTWRPGAYHKGTPAKQQALWTKWQLNYAKAMDALNSLA